MEPFVHDVWSSPAWRDAAESWIHQTLTAHGLRQTGPIEQPRVRPWSTQLTVPTDSGLLWFKENIQAMHYEVALAELLGRLAPTRVIIPLAIELQRGWMLSPDGGQTLASLARPDEAMWIRIVQEYAELQRSLVDHEALVLSTGTPRLLPTDAPRWASAYAEGLAALPCTDPRSISVDDWRAIKSSLGRLRVDAELLEQGPVPLSLDHNDLHHNNAFIPAEGRPITFFDFGDALWAHPFSSLGVTIDLVRQQLDAGPADPRLQRIADAYLEVWSDRGPLRVLRPLLHSARRFGWLHRAHSWQLVLSSTRRSTGVSSAVRVAGRCLSRQLGQTSTRSTRRSGRNPQYFPTSSLTIY